MASNDKVPDQRPSASAAATAGQQDDEPDEWDKRIFSTGCSDENARLTDCYYEKKDWRLCKSEASENLGFGKCQKAPLIANTCPDLEHNRWRDSGSAGSSRATIGVRTPRMYDQVIP
ncbi:hypothetical protein NEUTE2DRAFT_117902 [Neurospora tetrasperma FGSC 2509]|nr:hypothetical protein NEUTE2DRAFT_117902 [Neurospora tetrasperma FGSC 2509]